MSSLVDSLNAAMADACSVTGQDFTWNGNTYEKKAVLNSENATIVVSKATFSDGNYPQAGDPIKVAGREFQVIRLQNAGFEFVPGGLVESAEPFIDDPNYPLLAIKFDTFINA